MIELNHLQVFLENVNCSFPIPLSEKLNLELFSKKLIEKGTLCAEIENDRIVSLVAGYTDNVIDNRGYISIVATIDEAKGKGYASKLIKEFITICKDKKLSSLHLYAVETNSIAIHMYKKLGFKRWLLENEQRPNDVHFIYEIDKEERK